MPRFAVIVPGAGKGERFGTNESKTLAKLDGRPVFLRSLERFINRDDVCQTLLVVGANELDEVKSKYGPNLGFMGVQVVEGGERRCDSVAAALQLVKEEAEFIAIHDAVRPCVTDDMIDSVFAEAAKTGAAILAAPLHGTIKRVAESGFVEKTVPREQLFEAQTPQVFRRDIIERAYQAATAGQDASAEHGHSIPANIQVTDDAQLVESTGQAVSVVVSDHSNLKITTKADIALGNAILKSRPARKAASKLGAFEEAQW